jgi:hypothetical protein
MKTKQEETMEWLLNEIKKDKETLEKEKTKFIQEIKGMKKDEIIPKPKKQTLWKRIKTVLRIS